MSGFSTPKRQLELAEEDYQKENHGLDSKRHKLEAVLASIAKSNCSIQKSYVTASRVDILNDTAQQMTISSGELDIEHPKTSLLSPLRVIPRIQDAPSPQISSTLLDLRSAGAALHPPCNQKDEEICFGMLRDIQIRITRLQEKNSITFEEVGRDEDIFQCPKLVFEEDRCNIQSQEGVSIASMNKKTHFMLRSLSSADKVRYLGLLPRAKFKEKLDTAAQPFGLDSTDLTCSMSLLVFGVRSIADTLAKELSRYRLFLQHPYPMPTHIIYENPQYLSMIVSPFPNGTLLPPISVETSQPEIEADPYAEELEHDAEDLMAVMNNLPTHDYLKEADIDNRIKTKLLWHQKEAVDFAMRREGIGDTKPRSLWRLDPLTSGSPVYTHIITGSKSPAPDDMLGGILADDMGLGKTLTMIATIVATIPRAECFVAGKLWTRENTKAPMIPVKSTLIIVPSALLLDGWIDELKEHLVPETLKYYKYHGSDRCLTLSSPLPYDIVFSTYGTIAEDFRRGGGVLDCFHWYRLILDEAHIVRNWSTKQFKAVANLSASIRWCMTGTPVQNSLHDLGSLIKFLRVPLFDDTAVFRKYIAGKQKMGSGVWKPDYENLKLLLGLICLRRSTSVLSLLGVKYVELRPQLSEVERRVYEDLAMLCKRSIDTVVSGRGEQGGNKAILTALLRLRMFCNTGLASTMRPTSGHIAEQFGPDEIISLFQQSGEAACVKCGSDILSLDTRNGSDQQKTIGENRLKCLECVSRVTRPGDGGSCSGGCPGSVYDGVGDNQNTLQQSMQSGYEGSSYYSNTASGHSLYPSKLRTLLADIKEHYSQDKSIIFSFWRKSLDLVGRLFLEEGIIFCRVDGDLYPAQRKKVLTEFHDDPSIRVLLMTLGTGAVGLNNLSVASRVHVLEPQWNPSVEGQAIGRVFRLGQGKKVYVIRYIMKETIEESVESLQIMKVQLALKGGLQSSDEKFRVSKGPRKVAHLRALSKIIESTISTRARS